MLCLHYLCTYYFKVAVKQIFHGNNCFLNIVETKPFTPLNSKYLLSNPGNRYATQSAINCITIHTGFYFRMIFQDDGSNNFTEIHELFTVS